MNAVFLDTVGILALLERSDQWHHSANRAWAALGEAGRPLRTTTLVLYECANAVARKPYRHRIAEIRREFLADGTLTAPSESDLDTAWEAYERGEAGQSLRKIWLFSQDLDCAQWSARSTHGKYSRWAA